MARFLDWISELNGCDGVRDGASTHFGRSMAPAKVPG
jgi:hypothetical protein